MAPPNPSNLSRRQFLVQSASIAGASVGLRATRSDGEGEPGSEVRLGFIGLGDRGRHLLGAALGIAEARVVGLCDVHPERLRNALEIAGRRRPKRREEGPRGYTDARALLDATDIDAVLIATPVFLHRSQTVDALSRGKHVYCEKPMALTPAECREVVVACGEAERRGQIYQAGFQRRYNPRYRASLDYIHGGGAGEALFVRAQWHAVSPARKGKPWLHRRGKSGDIVLEQACHQFDVFNWVFGRPPLRASAAGGAHRRDGPPGRDVLDHYGAVLEFPGGGNVQLSHVTYSVPDRRFAGIYELAFCENSGVDLANALAWDGAGKTRRLTAETGNETQLAVRSFIDALIRGRRPVAGAEVAYDATLSALMCRRAIETGRPVSFEELELA